MVETIPYIKHPLAHNKASAAWWVLTYLIRAISSVLIVFCFASSMPWDKNTPTRAALFFLAMVAIYALQRALTHFTNQQINFHTPGYMANYSIFDEVKGHSPALDNFAELILASITVFAFYGFNPGNEMYSSAALFIGNCVAAFGLIRLIRAIYTLVKNPPTHAERNYWPLFIPLSLLLIISPLYKSFPAWAGIAANRDIADAVLIVTLIVLFFPSLIKRLFNLGK